MRGSFPSDHGMRTLPARANLLAHKFVGVVCGPPGARQQALARFDASAESGENVCMVIGPKRGVRSITEGHPAGVP